MIIRQLQRHHSSNVLPLISLIASCLILGCADDDGRSNSASACEFEPLKNQATTRFQAGQTYYLPTVIKGCGGASWVLSEAPSGNRNSVMQGETYARFTPVVPGQYQFTFGQTENTHSLTVVPHDARTFHNLNYYPTRSVTMVEESIWVANVYTPTISILDPTTLDEIDELIVGSWPVAIAWRDGLAVAVVAQKGNDTLGLVDIETRTLIDAVWVGDEPANVVVHPTEPIAYTVLSTTGEVVKIDLDTRRVVGKTFVTRDPMALAIDVNGSTIAVASYRSGHTNRFPYEDSARADQVDLVFLNSTTLETKSTALDLGTTIRGLEFSPDGSILYVANTVNDTVVSLADVDEPSFIHEVVAIDPETADIKMRADLLRQPSSGGHAVQLYGMALTDSGLFVTSEGTDQVIELDPSTLEEVRRLSAPGRPRGIVSHGETVFIHGAQSFSVTRISGASVTTGKTEVEDPRDERVARGQRYFTGQGEGYGQNWSCNACHTDGLSDTIIWNAGPFEDRVVSRPFFWLEGTYPLGWAGYQSNIRNYALAVNTNIGIRPDTEEFEGLWYYLASLMPPPAATSLTRRDGSLSDAATRGKAIYEGDATCAACHALPLTTNRSRFPEGITGGVTDVPGLVGIYRYNVWLKHGEADTLRDATVAALEFMEVDTLSDPQIDDLTRYIEELTARDFFTLTISPLSNKNSVAVDTVFSLTFSMPVWDNPENLAHIKVLDDSGAEVEIERTVSGRHVTVIPKAVLTHDTGYTLAIDGQLQAENERRLFAAETHVFQTAKTPELRLEGDYVFIADMPVLNIVEGVFDRMSTIEVALDLQADAGANGAQLRVDYKEDLEMTIQAVVDGTELTSEPFPIPIGPSFADATGMTQALLTDEDGDGVADLASGTLVISGPGFEESGVTWTLRRPQEAGCQPGLTGNVEFSVTFNDEGYPRIEWEDGLGALAVLVTDESADIPLGPGIVTNGATYLSMQSADFPTPFNGPITPENPIPNGANDTTESNGGTPGGDPVPEGICAKVFILFDGFEISEYVFER